MMLFTLGQRSKSGDVVDLLLACHHRIREHLALARRLSHASAATAPDSVRGAAARVRSYFATAFPLHREDEEHDIFPLLLGQTDMLDAAIGELMADHEDHDCHVAAIVAVCAALEHDPSRLHAHANELALHVKALEDDLLAHVSLEEQTVFPAIARLPAELRQQIHDRMRARRV
jgi:iron-sulfur cluster repair protein YtfE (RIC family)